MKAKRVLLVGWDAADWKIIDQLIERGQMPALKGMIEKGVRGNLSTLDPVLSPMLWSSIATGKYADKHGIHGFTEVDYEHNIVKPITSTSRKARAIWNILSHQEYKCNVFSWWPSNPAEPINGICVSNLYQRANAPIDKPWPMMAGTVHPQSMSKHFASCRVHPDELTAEHVLPFIPRAAEIDQEKDHRIGSFSKILADAATVHAASTWAIENTEWDFLAVYHDAIDHACHGYMKFRAPQLKGVPDNLFNLYKDVVDGMYQFHDMMLERLIQLAGPDTNIILISDHGFQSDHHRPLVLPKEPAAPALEHRKHGIICCMGPDFKSNTQIYGSSVIDITPTLLTLFDLPIGMDMDGTPLLQLFKEVLPVKRIESWENVEGSFGEHSDELKVDKEEAKNQVRQLIDLGYIEDPGENMQKAIETTEIEAKFNLSRVYSSTGRPLEALKLLEEINAIRPTYRFHSRIADCLKRLGRNADALQAIAAMKSLYPDEAKLGTMLMEAEILIQENKTQEAVKTLAAVNQKAPGHPAVMRSLAECHIQLKDFKTAQKIYTDLIRFDPHDAANHKGLALCLLRLKKYEQAVEEALTATELVYQFPTAHFVLAEALAKMNEPELSARSLKVVLAMRPEYTPAKRMLTKLVKKFNLNTDALFADIRVEEMDGKTFDRELSELETKSQMAVTREAKTKGEVIIVSGLPRSGTSLMMQMLNAAGKEIYTDQIREADENNPKGFYEHENVKSLARNSRWLNDANEKVVKVISQLVRHLPGAFRYKVIFMKRDVNEVVVSQHQMLVREGKAKADSYPLKMEQAFKKAYENSLKWAHRNNNVDWIEVRYDELIAKPDEYLASINEFLGGQLNTSEMKKCIDASLYRNRMKSKTES